MNTWKKGRESESDLARVEGSLEMAVVFLILIKVLDIFLAAKSFGGGGRGTEDFWRWIVQSYSLQ